MHLISHDCMQLSYLHVSMIILCCQPLAEYIVLHSAGLPWDHNQQIRYVYLSTAHDQLLLLSPQNIRYTCRNCMQVCHQAEPVLPVISRRAYFAESILHSRAMGLDPDKCDAQT